MGLNKLQLAAVSVLGCGIVSLILVSVARSNSGSVTLDKGKLLYPPGTVFSALNNRTEGRRALKRLRNAFQKLITMLLNLRIPLKDPNDAIKVSITITATLVKSQHIILQALSVNGT